MISYVEDVAEDTKARRSGEVRSVRADERGVHMLVALGINCWLVLDSDADAFAVAAMRDECLVTGCNPVQETAIIPVIIRRIIIGVQLLCVSSPFPFHTYHTALPRVSQS